MLLLATEDPLAVSARLAIQTGDVETLKRLLDRNPALATARIGGCGPGEMARTLLHVATDWPGNFPNGAEMVTLLIEYGAEVNAKFIGPHSETPLHWAASCDDVEVVKALIHHGADLEAPGAVIGNGTPLADAVAFGQWKAARTLIDHGAKTLLWQAAGLGLMLQMDEHFAKEPGPTSDEITSAFWCACHGGQREAAESLLCRGADSNWVGYDGLTLLQAAKRSGANELVERLLARTPRA